MYISKAQNRLAEIYPNNDLGIDYLFGYVFRSLGYISISIDEGDIERKVLERFVKTASWILAIYNKLKADSIVCILRKYPDCCPYCLKKPCQCYKERKIDFSKSHEIKEKYENYMANRISEFDLDKLASLINDIYPFNESRWRECGKSRHFERIFQEMSELHESVSRFVKDNAEISRVLDEVSDVFAWTLSAWKIYLPEHNIEQNINGYYLSGCPVCKAVPCNCPPRSDNIDRVLSRRKAREIALLINRAGKEIEGDEYLKRELQELYDIMNRIIEENVEYNQKVARKKVAEVMQKMQGYINKAGDMSKNVINVVRLVSELKDIFG